MNILKASIIFILLFISTSSAFAVDERYRDKVQTIIDLFSDGNKEGLSKLIKYPLERQAPISSVKNAKEMVERFDDVFDQEFVSMITSSTPDEWSLMGWRGVMFKSGLLWMDLDGTIWSVTYQSQIEEQIKDNLILSKKQTLHKSVKQFSKPVLEWKTSKFHIRVDDLGRYNYRYAVWPIGVPHSNKPDLVLEHGELEFDGSGGNRSYTFTNGKYKYKCFVWALGTSTSPPGILEVFRGDELLLSDHVVEVVHN
ncbi:hypothetical protein [Simiduia aestuariiviva]|uniref:Uncharacterized protein n=1 Tax=Simiduia aestuariiviva TaxID=1510459 RepID=A0A839USX2_9GAMM|nr:hypothetical protein [Simiduia aestuariiviva]MBB3168598.1 hypothetical protein [Simiduia aestuariiviva]